MVRGSMVSLGEHRYENAMRAEIDDRKKDGSPGSV